MAGSQAFIISAHGVSDVGMRRDHNEDSFLVDLDLGLLIVADGMGGHAGGEHASRLAVETIQREVRSARESNRLVIQVQPAEGIQLHIQTKVPDAGMNLRLTDLAFRFQEKFAAVMPDSYQRLLLDAGSS